MRPEFQGTGAICSPRPTTYIHTDYVEDYHEAPYPTYLIQGTVHP